MKVEPAKDPHARPGNSNARKDDNAGENFPPEKRERKTGANSPERIIARLKRDAATDPQAEAMLGSIEAGEMGLRQPSGGHKWGARNKKGPIGPFCCSSNRLFYLVGVRGFEPPTT